MDIREHFIYTYKKLNLPIDEQKIAKENILYDVVFTQGNTHAPDQMLSTARLTASTAADDHRAGVAQSI
jgi:hypothetical protein